MDLKLESREGFLQATAAGQVSLNEMLKLGKNICDVAVERGFSRILFDCLAFEGELSTMEKYEFGKTIAEYCRDRSMTPTVAAVCKPRTINGFAAQVAWNRGLNVVMFSELQPARHWLEGFGSKATTS